MEAAAENIRSWKARRKRKNCWMDLEWPADVTERVCYLVGHHHTYHDMDGMDYQILVEADFLVNLFEDKVSPEGCRNAYHKIFRTESGKRLYRTMYPTV